MLVINLMGGPGVGKSTTAAELFALMKREGYNVELVTEYAKALVWAERFSMLQDQVYIFAKQSHQIQRLIGKVDYVVTDSPLLLSCIYSARYSADDFPKQSFQDLVVAINNTYDNINFVINRCHPYIRSGRSETEEMADNISDDMVQYLINHNLPYTTVDSGMNVGTSILNSITQLTHNV